MLPAIFTNNRHQGFFPAVFNDFFNDSWPMPQFRNSAPAVNISEDEKQYKVEVAAPGMTKDDFKITVTKDDIVIAMEKKSSSDNANENEKADQKKYIRREFSYSKFEQRLGLPDNVDRKAITAQMNDGVLNIDIPKLTPEEKAQECQCIEIK